MKKIFTLISAIAISACTFAQTFSIENVEVAKGETAKVTISATTPSVMAGLGGVVTLPEDFKFASWIESVFDEDEEEYVDKEVLYSKGERVRGASSIACNLQEVNKIKFAITNTSTNDPFTSKDGSIITLSIQAPATVGEYVGTYTPDVSVKAGNEKYAGGNVEFKINVVDATAINAINAEEAGSTIYNVAGAVQNSMKKGVNIVKMNNGQVKKVMVK